ncbi:hypothetical protein EV421DRAFT_1742292 [Armillaria borealis]|uniref:Uncharacterized protein n=1 Tax=Armillaria borealis TaxID=47425 RepID=A0AA39IXU0_9AGAR|nr:hypothetical protein EV421DRAFT_1742292 [Armillaria borealis]
MLAQAGIQPLAKRRAVKSDARNLRVQPSRRKSDRGAQSPRFKKDHRRWRISSMKRDSSESDELFITPKKVLLVQSVWYSRKTLRKECLDGKYYSILGVGIQDSPARASRGTARAEKIQHVRGRDDNKINSW